MVVGVLYWAAWRIVPRWFGVEYVPRKEVLADGTVVTLVRPVSWCLGLDARDADVLVLRSSRGKRLSEAEDGLLGFQGGGGPVTTLAMLYYGIYGSVVMEA